MSAGNIYVNVPISITHASGLILGEDAATNIAGCLKMFSAGANAFYTTFTTGTQTGNCAYTLPLALPGSNKVLQCTSGGVLSWETGGGGASAINDLTDVDTVSDAPVRGETLKWNGTNWVPVAYDYNFTFSCTGFSTGETATQLLGTGNWKAIGALSCTASYLNGPPTSAEIQTNTNSAGWVNKGQMTGPAYTLGANGTAIAFPSAPGQTIQCRLSSTDGVDPDTDSATTVTFLNYRFWGTLNKNTGITETDIEGLSSELYAAASASNYSKTINSSSGQYIIIAYPDTGSNTLEGGDDYEDDSNSDFLFNSFVCAFKEQQTLTITNTAGYAETYEYYVSEQSNLGNYTLTTSSSGAIINKIHYGVSTTSTGWSSAQIAALTSTVSNTTGRTVAITAGASEYIIYAIPSRLTSVHATGWLFNTIAAAFQSAETISVTNVNGYTENYKVYRSTLANLGTADLTTSTTSNVINYIYWGEREKSSTYNETDVENYYVGRVVSDSISSRSMTVACSGTEYTYISYPSRLNPLTSIIIGGFESIGDFTVDNTALSITNSSGYTETYRVYVSVNPGISNTMLVTI
jgi:hypothetical protein